MFGSTWGNAQQNTQQPQQTSAFGQPSAFGATPANNAFGSTSAFGQPQQQSQPAQQPQVNPMFGNLATPSTNTQSTGFGAFGGSSTGNTGGAFGMKPATGFGAFSGGTNAFGGTTTSAFGQPGTGAAPATTSVFGQPAATTTNAFGGGASSVFGGNKFGATAATTSSAPVVTTGTSNPPYNVVTEKDGTTTSQYQSISCMPAYIGYSFEELRVQDYAQNRKTATNTGAFGQTAFGSTQPATTNVFGAQTTQQQPANLFGGSTNTTNTAFGAFGQPATTQPATNVFGGGGTGAFGQPQQQQQQQTNAFGTTSAFGQPQQQQSQPQQTSIFGGGTSAFGSTANKPAFGAFGGGGGTNPFSTGASAFGTQPQNTQQPAQTTNIFGTPQPAANAQPSAFGAFGAASNAPKPSVFGTSTTTQPTTSAFGGFGTTQQQQPAQTQQNAQPSIFGTGSSIFGQQQNQPQQQQQQPAQTTSLFGGQTTTPSLFGNTNTGLFGNTQQTQQPQQQQQPQGQTQTGTNIFGNLFTKPAQPTTSLFGGGQTQTTTQPQQTSLFGNLGQTNQTNSLFGPKPAAPLLGGSMSGSQAPGLFGATTSNQGAQGSLTASINQPIGENLPIFAMLPPGPRLYDLEQSKKRAGVVVDLPLRSPLPKVPVGYSPASSKLRGFGSSPSLTSSTSGAIGSSSVFMTPARSGSLNFSVADSMSSSVDPDFLGRSGSPALGSGGRHSVKVILDKKLDPSELFVKTGSPGGLRAGKVTFSPALSVSAREKDTTSPSGPQQQDVTAPSQTQPPKSSNQHPDSTTKDTPVSTDKEESTELGEGDYWVKPDLALLKKVGYEHLSAFEGLVVGRKGYGEIQFLEPVDLTGVPKLGALFGEVIRFDDKECSVYPDSEDADKPPPGSGLNVKAKLSLERCWTVDKATREPITDPNHPSNVKHLKRLKNMKATHFENFDMKTGTWTFTVDHF